ncbi:hypothetical protein NDU88_005807 [Pleurodeles waltl]|uniref:Uncharacterized protein n=1 Tax=Pleurodeles waltl TaxID=8319 RepID=A0AAV7WVS0_PLEWA|nr:hypothetical protein NDU88_005807 [Pleurodeles waltl]
MGPPRYHQGPGQTKISNLTSPPVFWLPPGPRHPAVATAELVRAAVLPGALLGPFTATPEVMGASSQFRGLSAPVPLLAVNFLFSSRLRAAPNPSLRPRISGSGSTQDPLKKYLVWSKRQSRGANVKVMCQHFPCSRVLRGVEFVEMNAMRCHRVAQCRHQVMQALNQLLSNSLCVRGKEVMHRF